MKTVAKTIFHEAGNALKKIKENPKHLFIAGMFDIFFFIAYGFFTAPLFGKIIDYVIIIGTIVSEETSSALRSGNPSLTSIITNNPEASALLNNLIFVFLALAGTIYIIYTITQGMSWRQSTLIAGRKISLHEYLKTFAIINIFWVVAFSIQHIFSLMEDIRITSIGVGAESTNTPIFLLILISYFAFISYTFIGTKQKAKIKNSFKTGVLKIGYVLPAFAVIALVYFIFQNILKGINGINNNLMIAVGILIMIPAMTWARVYLTLIVEKAK